MRITEIPLRIDPPDERTILNDAGTIYLKLETPENVTEAVNMFGEKFVFDLINTGLREHIMHLAQRHLHKMQIDIRRSLFRAEFGKGVVHDD